jgi:hypothetical protein
MKSQFVLAAVFFACLLTDAQASSVYTLTENFGSENLIIEFKGALINGSSTLLSITEIDKVFINNVAASKNANPAGFTEQYSSNNTANAQIDLSNPSESNFSISETGTALQVSQTYSFPFYHDVIQTETGPSTLFLNSSLTSFTVNNGPISTVPEPTSLALLLIGFAGLMGKRLGLRKA